ncbi:hypothetical protein FVB9532_00294 [Mesonia oceanica]|uniref:Uncharacterized protein n=1 Tax=Mesonia oceanica TaxID=2687242 RepID=A0AC61Y6R9_9FLAO|nr:hypothetical protein FVB9532_00294 [Mesonia oceanica]
MQLASVYKYKQVRKGSLYKLLFLEYKMKFTK